jgi:gamma-glutamyl-gamma-aminobutyrate hydrolase PuuD
VGKVEETPKRYKYTWHGKNGYVPQIYDTNGNPIYQRYWESDDSNNVYEQIKDWQLPSSSTHFVILLEYNSNTQSYNAIYSKDREHYSLEILKDALGFGPKVKKPVLEI